MSAGKWFASGLWLLGAALAGQGAPPAAPALTITGDATPACRNEVRQVALAAEDVINTLCRSADAPVPLEFVLGGGERRLARQPGCVVPLRHADPLVRQTEIIRALLYRRALKWVKPPVAPEHVPGWLVAAVHYRTVTGGADPATGDGYLASRQLAAANQVPPLDRLVDHPAGPEEPLLFALYADVADILLRVLQRTDPLAANQILRRLDAQQTPWQVLRPLLPEKTDARVQAWFAERFRQVSERTRTLRTVDDLQTRIRELETVSLPGPTPDAPPRVIALDELPAAAPAYRLASPEPERRLEKLYLLLPDCPPLLVPALTEYLKAFTLLVQGQDAAGRKRLTDARTQFQAAAARTAKIRAALDALERTRAAPGQPLAAYQPLIEAPVHPLEFDRALQRYLDDLTRQLDPPRPPPPAGE